MKRIISIVLVMVLYVQVQAQNAIPITLEKVLELSGASNLTIIEYVERQELASAELMKAKEWWLPEIYVGSQTNYRDGAVMNGNGKFFLDVNRNNLWLGLGANATWDFAEGIYGTKAARLKKQASGYHTKSEQNKVLLESIDAYYDLIVAQIKLVAYKNLVLQSDTIVNQILIQVDAGLLFQSEALIAGSNKNHLKIEMLNAQKEYNTKSAELIKLLNLDQQVKLVSVDAVLLPLEYTETLGPNMNSFYLNRPEVKANDLEIEALKTLKKSYTTGLFLPKIAVGLSGSYFGKIDGAVTPIDPIVYPSTQQLYSTGDVHAALMWNIPIGALVYNGDNKRYKSMIRLQEVETEKVKAQINEEIIIATINIETGREQIEIAKESVELITKALSQSIARQKIGTAKPFEVFQAQQFYLQAQIDYLKSISEYNKAQFALKVARGEGL